MEVGNKVRTQSGEDPVFFPRSPHSHPAPGLWALIVRRDTAGLALAKVWPLLLAGGAPRSQGPASLWSSIVSLKLAHSENKFCLIFVCVPPPFFHLYNLDIWAGRSDFMLCISCIPPMQFFLSGLLPPRS